MDTVRHLEFLRDVSMPASLDLLRRREVLLESFSQRSAENARRAKDLLFGYQNGRKAILGELAGLQDPAVMRRKAKEQQALLAAASKDRQLQATCGKAIATIDKSLVTMATIREDYSLLEHGQAFNSELFQIARMLVRMAEENAKPNADRLREYRESNLESLKQQLFSKAPIYADVQTALLADSLSMLLEKKAPSYKKEYAVSVSAGGFIKTSPVVDELVISIMGDKSPRQRAAELVRGTKLADVAVRRQLAEGGIAAIEASNDPMIRLARLVDKPAREVRSRFEQQVEEPQRWAYGKLANARFRLYGTEMYPDATFTLRLAFGLVKGYRGERRGFARLDDHRRGISTRERARFKGTVRIAEKLAG